MSSDNINNNIVAEYSNSGWGGRGSLADLVTELQRQVDSKYDFVMDTRDAGVEVAPDGNPLLVAKRPTDWIPRAGIPIRLGALKQLAGRFSHKSANGGLVRNQGGPSVPGMYLENEWAANPDLVASLISKKMERTHKRWMFRCLDDSVRAVLSDSYRIIDNYDVVKAALQEAKQVGAKVLDCSLSENQMRLKLVRDDIWEKVNFVRSNGPRGRWYAGGLGNQDLIQRVGASSQGGLDVGQEVQEDMTHPAITISNSETGHGRTNGRVGLLGAVCFNLATVEQALAEVHIGGKQEVGIFSHATLRKEGELTYDKVGDLVRFGFNEERFRGLVERIRKAEKIEVADPTSAVAQVVSNNKLTQEDESAILEYFLGDYNRTQMGLAQAVSRRAQDLPDGDAAHDLEWAAGQLMLA